MTSRRSRSRPLPSGFVTFVFTDIEGSTRLFRTLGERYVDVLDRHNEVLRATWRRHDGVEIKTEGDSFFVVFADADAAVHAAADAQEVIASGDWPSPGLRIRLGVHSGLASPRDGDYIALAVHQAARVAAAANGGQSLVTEATREAATASKELLHPLGRYRVRDFDDPLDLYAAATSAAGDVLTAPRAVPASRHNIVTPAGELVGREEQLALVTEAVGPGRCVTIVGPGGVGKTRLAMALGLEGSRAWPGGIWLVELAPLAAEPAIESAIADVLAVAPGARDAIDAVVDEWQDRSALLVLDNCEHVVEPASRIAASLLQRWPAAGILATSREPLNIAREQVVRIGALDIDSAERLFRDRAQAAAPSFDPDESERAVIRRICEVLDRLPLAIELAAARVGDVSLEEIEEGLLRRFDLLRSRRRDLDPRQRSLTGLLDWSHDLLSLDEQHIFELLSLFAGSVSVEAMTAASSGAHDRNEVVDSLWALADKSLLSVAVTAGETRFEVANTVRRYAHDRVRDRTRLDEAAVDLATHFAERFGRGHMFDLTDAGALSLELATLRHLVGELTDVEPRLAQELAILAAYARDVTGEHRIAVEEIETWRSSLRTLSAERAVLLASAARLHSRVGDSDYGPLLDEAEAIIEVVGREPDWAEGVVAGMRALWEVERGEVEAALARCRVMVEHATTDAGFARAYSTQGYVLGLAGRAEEAHRAHTTALQYEERLGGVFEIAVAHNNLAEQSIRLGRHTEAARHQLAALELAAEAGSMILVTFSFMIAAVLADAQGRWDEAALLIRTAASELERSGYALADDEATEFSELADRVRTRSAATEELLAHGPALEPSAAILLATEVFTRQMGEMRQEA